MPPPLNSKKERGEAAWPHIAVPRPRVMLVHTSVSLGFPHSASLIVSPCCAVCPTHQQADPEIALRLTALETMVNEVRTSTSSMTSVPKPKFLRPHYATLKGYYTEAKPGRTRPSC